MAWTEPIMTFWANVILTAAQLNTYVRDALEFLKENILLEAATELTISAGGSVTVTKSYHKIDTFGDAATFNLDTIGPVGEGRILFLRAENTARTVVLKNGANLILGGDISLDDTSKHVALICDSVGNWHLLNSSRDLTFMVNAFQYPVPSTEWGPSAKGAHLPVAQTGAITYLPLNFLKIGDVIVSYNLTGDMTVTGTSTLDCRLVRINLDHPIGTTNITNGAIAQQTGIDHFNVTATVDDETVTTEMMYYLLITGTTDAADQIHVMGAEVLVRRLV